MIIPTNAIRLKGNWTDGYALDVHVVKSTFLGYDDFGFAKYNTERSPIGESIYQLKYQKDNTRLADIIETTCDFIVNKWAIIERLHYILPTPPSNPHRVIQPVTEIAKGLCVKLNIPLSLTDLIKIAETKQLKDESSDEEKLKTLEGAFSIKTENLKEKNILLVDDLFDSGSTFRVITEILYNKGGVNNVYVLSLSKTGKN